MLGGGDNDMTAVDTRHSVALLADKVNNTLHRVVNIESTVVPGATAPSRMSMSGSGSFSNV